MAYCADCGTKLQIEDLFCGECGATIQSSSQAKTVNNLATKHTNIECDATTNPGTTGFFKSHRNLILVIGATLMVVMLGIAATLIYSKFDTGQKIDEQRYPGKDGSQLTSVRGASAASAESSIPTQRGKNPINVELAPFTLNLQPEAGEQYLQVSISLNMKDQAHADELQQNMPGVRNKLLLILSNKKASEISTANGKLILSEEIKNQLNALTSQDEAQGILDVFFTSFVIQ